MSKIVDRLRDAGVAPVIRTKTETTARRAVDLLREEGFDLFEITLTTPGALSIIRDLAADPALSIGAGTVLTTGQGADAIAAGARFVVSPAFVSGLTTEATSAGVAVVLGAATPTEALRAQEDGADFVKIFPARQLGGPGFIRALCSVYPEMAFMPTGGIEPPDISAYFAAGAVCLGMGGKLVSQAALTAKDDAVIRNAARAVRAALASRK